MPLYLCRWPNGDFSIADAEDEIAAIILFDEAGDIIGTVITPLGPGFMVHFTNPEGQPTFQDFGELTWDELKRGLVLFDEQEEDPH